MLFALKQTSAEPRLPAGEVRLGKQHFFALSVFAGPGGAAPGAGNNPLMTEALAPAL